MAPRRPIRASDRQSGLPRPRGPSTLPRTLRAYVEALERSPAAAGQQQLLDRIIADPPLHARLVNTFARMEYVGVRKILKSRRCDSLDLDGLQHILDETVHALRLKKGALALAPRRAEVATFSAADTLAGDAGEDYLQAVDRAAEASLQDLPESTRTEVNYLLTSAAIEVRAQAFYPLYESRLRAAEVAMSVAAIVRDEDRHLQEMADRLSAALPDWRPRLERVLAMEAGAFAEFLAAVSVAVSVADADAGPGAVAPELSAHDLDHPVVLAVRQD
jgi:hypothetical protein